MGLLFGLLEFMGIERERVRLEWVSAAEGARFADTMGDFVARVGKLGKNKRLLDTRHNPPEGGGGADVT
jgi:coenzyme F420-reducing hydrogenase delta subunit